MGQIGFKDTVRFSLKWLLGIVKSNRHATWQKFFLLLLATLVLVLVLVWVVGMGFAAYLLCDVFNGVVGNDAVQDQNNVHRNIQERVNVIVIILTKCVPAAELNCCS